ncbi:MAG: alpha/beta hydrolase [Gemmatimonadaceae bacterium]|nr:alpha/beta hydrolase [Chitinophagaceae bacterium]
MKLAQKLAVNYIRAKLNLLAVLSPRKAAYRAFDLFCTPQYRSKKPLPPIFQNAEKLTMKFGLHSVNGYRWNRGGIRKVLILHGYESGSPNFERYIAPLVRKDYEVLAFDAPAHGKSPGRRITLPLYIEMIADIHRQYGPVLSFMAHSFGGLAVTHFLEQTTHDVETRLALIAPATETSTAIDSFFRFLQLNGKVRKEFEIHIYEKAGIRPEHFSIARAVKNIKAGMLWVHDEDDDITPLADVKPIMESNIPHLDFMITKGFGHKKIYRENKVVKAVTAFL